MSKRVRQAGKARRVVKKIFFLTLSAVIIFIIIGKLYPKMEAFYASYQNIDTSEADSNYDLLLRHGALSGYLVLDLGIDEGDDIQIAINRLKDVMGLKEYKIWLAHHSETKPPAYIKELGYGDMGLYVSDKIKEVREIINLLTHELGHIYVWKRLGGDFKKPDEEKLVDASGVFLGLGILILNGFTDEQNLKIGGEYETKKKFFGYLKPREFGYLMARYCVDHGIKEEKIRKFLNPSGRKYFDIGMRCLKKKGAGNNLAAKKVRGIYWRDAHSSPEYIDLN